MRTQPQEGWGRGCPQDWQEQRRKGQGPGRGKIRLGWKVESAKGNKQALHSVSQQRWGGEREEPIKKAEGKEMTASGMSGALNNLKNIFSKRIGGAEVKSTDLCPPECPQSQCSPGQLGKRP